jgi:hypothetical protein
MQQPQIDVSKTTPLTNKNGKQVWLQGYLLRKMSKFILGTPEDAIIPIPFFYHPENGEIFTDAVPPELKNILFTQDVINELENIEVEED